MSRFLLQLLFLILIPPTPMQTVTSLVDKNRVLLVFAPSDRDPRFQSQWKTLALHSADIKERDLICIPVLMHSGQPVGADTLRQLQPPPISDSEQLLLRTQFHIGSNNFTLILLGKDGGEKLRTSAPLTITRLNQTIDAMPMRQDEMKRKTR